LSVIGLSQGQIALGDAQRILSKLTKIKDALKRWSGYVLRPPGRDSTKSRRPRSEELRLTSLVAGFEFAWAIERTHAECYDPRTFYIDDWAQAEF